MFLKVKGNRTLNLRGHQLLRVTAVLFFFLLSFLEISSAQFKDSIISNHDNKYKQEDLLDFARRITKVNVSEMPDSVAVKPGRLLLAVCPALGYTISNGLIGIIAINTSFYTANPSNTNLSNVIFYPQYSILNQIVLPLTSSIWFDKNEFNILSDFRYYKYPSYTYGLGGLTSFYNYDYIDYSYLRVNQEALMRIANNLYGGIGYAMDYHFNIVDYDNETDFQQYDDDASHTMSSGLLLHVKYDSRTNINNPKNAFFGSVVYRNNTTWLGSDQNWQSVQLDFRKYIKLPGNPANVLAFWNWDVFTYGGKAPYLDLPSTGWDSYTNTGRGYIQGRFRSTSLVYLEGEYRFGITKNGLLGGVVFVNTEIVPEWPSNMYKSVNPGEGIGIRIKWNRFSDTNLCIDYGFGNQGSRGFYFNLGEVF